ncbi:hypothetical protein M405DRAFT_843384 [Rhizopogon salebrosus TDB-379]|nr:hypothetical protein M405DRAFT_843384 [Rhizopogon salebrosus TDB-379]
MYRMRQYVRRVYATLGASDVPGLTTLRSRSRRGRLSQGIGARCHHVGTSWWLQDMEPHVLSNRWCPTDWNYGTFYPPRPLVTLSRSGHKHAKSASLPSELEARLKHGKTASLPSELKAGLKHARAGSVSTMFPRARVGVVSTMFPRQATSSRGISTISLLPHRAELKLGHKHARCFLELEHSCQHDASSPSELEPGHKHACIPPSKRRDSQHDASLASELEPVSMLLPREASSSRGLSTQAVAEVVSRSKPTPSLKLKLKKSKKQASITAKQQTYPGHKGYTHKYQITTVWPLGTARIATPTCRYHRCGRVIVHPISMHRSKLPPFLQSQMWHHDGSRWHLDPTWRLKPPPEKLHCTANLTNPILRQDSGSQGPAIIDFYRYTHPYDVAASMPCIDVTIIKSFTK